MSKILTTTASWFNSAQTKSTPGTLSPDNSRAIRGLSRPLQTRCQLANELQGIILQEVSTDLCAIMAALRNDSQSIEAKANASAQATRILNGCLSALDLCHLWNGAHRHTPDIWQWIARELPPTYLKQFSDEYDSALTCIVQGETWAIARGWLEPEVQL